MSTSLAKMASALTTMSSTLASIALTDPASTAPSPAQPEGSKLTPTERLVHVFICGVDTLDSQGGKDPVKQSMYTDNIRGIYRSREMGKDADRRWLTEEVDGRLNDFDLTDDKRHALKEHYLVPETDDDWTWETGWIDWGDSLEEPSATGENLSYSHLRLVGKYVEAASDEVSGGR